jgi:hypothetical protein
LRLAIVARAAMAGNVRPSGCAVHTAPLVRAVFHFN